MLKREKINEEKRKEYAYYFFFFNLFFLSPSQNLKKVFVEFSHQELFEFYNKVCGFYNIIVSL